MTASGHLFGIGFLIGSATILLLDVVCPWRTRWAPIGYAVALLGYAALIFWRVL